MGSRYGFVDTKTVLYPGRHTKFEWQHIVPIDATYEPVTFSVDTSNQLIVFLDGVDIRMDAVVQYRPDPPRLEQLYTKYNTGYLSQIVSQIQPTLKAATSLLGKDDYVGRRNETEAKLGLAVQEILDCNLSIIAPADKFKLLRVYFPQSIVNSNLAASLEVSRDELAHYTQQVTVAKGESDRLVAVIDAQTAQVNAVADIEARRVISESENLARSMSTSARALAQIAMFDRMGINNATVQSQLVRYFDILDTAGSLKILSGMSTSPLLSV